MEYIESIKREGMHMDFCRVDAGRLSCETFLRYAELEKGASREYASIIEMKKEMLKFCVIGGYQGESLVGFAVLDNKSRLLPESVHICKLRWDWKQNNDTVISELITGAAASADGRFVTMDVNRKHNWNRALYQRMGFSDSALASPSGKDYVIMIADRKKLINQQGRV